jgi:cytochrome c-type biogenesis protein CcsB
MTATNWGYLSNYGVYSALVFYTIAFFSHAFEFSFAIKSEPALVGDSAKTVFDFTSTKQSGRLGTAMMILGSLALLIADIARAISAGRFPLGNMYEFSLTGALAFSLAYLLGLFKFKMRWLGTPVSFALLLILGTAITLLYRPSAPLVPALKSTWLVIHVTSAILSGGVFLLANCVAGLYLILEKMERTGARPKYLLALPTLESLDQLTYRLIALVFPLWTFAIIAGAIWAESAWGHYWSWDPKETWALITWIAYAAYLHARATVGWKGRKAAWLCIFAGSTFLFNYVYINVWGTGRHTYSGL